MNKINSCLFSSVCFSPQAFSPLQTRPYLKQTIVAMHVSLLWQSVRGEVLVLIKTYVCLHKCVCSSMCVCVQGDEVAQLTAFCCGQFHNVSCLRWFQRDSCDIHIYWSRSVFCQCRLVGVWLVLGRPQLCGMFNQGHWRPLEDLVMVSPCRASPLNFLSKLHAVALTYMYPVLISCHRHCLPHLQHTCIAAQHQ